MLVPLRSIIGAEDLDEARQALVDDLGDAVVAVFWGCGAFPDQRNAPGTRPA
jgi:hypothetical protein